MEKGAVIAETNTDISDSALSSKEMKRIFIGGIGSGVTAIDVEKTFSPLGSVHAVEFVRSNGRNLAFMDFEPSSVRSLAKLFSTYNGCTWKGGKLKLEIAKEHYLTRLQKEWDDDAKLASASPTKESLEFVKSHCSSQENSQIRIFFPNLRKVKPLPFKGTGKHKYSFQRVDVPPLPIHFCDCEEHSKELETISQTYLSPLSTVVHEKERSIIVNVMNKLMGGDKVLSPRNEDIHFNEAEVSDVEDDNLVMNIGVGAEDDILMQLKGGMTQSACQEFGFGNPQSSKDRSVQNKPDSGKRKKYEVTNASSFKPDKRSRPISADEFSNPKPTPAITQNLTSTSTAAESAPSFSPISSNSEIPAETSNSERKMKPNMSNSQPKEGQSWRQKCSWKDLVGGRESSSFSISNVLSGFPSSSLEIPKDDASDTIALKKAVSFGEKSKLKTPHNAWITPQIPAETPNDSNRQNRPNVNDDQLSKGQSWLSGLTSKPSEMPKAYSSDTIATQKFDTFGEKSKQKTPQKESSTSESSEDRAIGVQQERKDTPEFNFGEVCPFMRNAESEQQWSKAKAALSGYFKRSSNEGNASKVSKGKAQGRR